MATVTYHAREATFKYATGLTINSSTTLESQFSGGTAIGVMKDITISPPEGDVDIVNFLGEDASGFQNALLEEKSFGLAEITGTMSIDADETLQTIAYGAGTSSASGYTRYRAGNGTRATDGGFLVLLDNGTAEMAVVLNNLIITKLGDIKPTGTDGHWEQEFTAKCLPADYHEEIKD